MIKYSPPKVNKIKIEPLKEESSERHEDDYKSSRKSPK